MQTALQQQIKHPRSSGYYWIKWREKGNWIIAEWEASIERWMLCGIQTQFHEKQIFEINEIQICKII